MEPIIYVFGVFGIQFYVNVFIFNTKCTMHKRLNSSGLMKCNSYNSNMQMYGDLYVTERDSC